MEENKNEMKEKFVKINENASSKKFGRLKTTTDTLLIEKKFFF